MQVETKTCSKYFKRPAIVVPSDNIRLCKKPLDGTTTTSSAYVCHPGYKPAENCKPQALYTRSHVGSATETTHKLSFQPPPLGKREKFPWAEKKPYRPPEAALDSSTTYSSSFIPLEKISREKPIKPRLNSSWVNRTQDFPAKSSYSEAFVPLPFVPAVPRVPSGNIGFSGEKMENLTTSQVSYQPWKPLGQEILPWKPRFQYKKPSCPLDDSSIYRSSFVPPGPVCYEECDGLSCPLTAENRNLMCLG